MRNFRYWRAARAQKQHMPYAYSHFARRPASNKGGYFNPPSSLCCFVPFVSPSCIISRRSEKQERIAYLDRSPCFIWSEMTRDNGKTRESLFKRRPVASPKWLTTHQTALEEVKTRRGGENEKFALAHIWHAKWCCSWKFFPRFVGGREVIEGFRNVEWSVASGLLLLTFC